MFTLALALRSLRNRGVTSTLTHDESASEVVGILWRTFTPVDRALYATLEGIEAIHLGWEDGAPPAPGNEASPERVLALPEIPITQVTSFLLGLHDRRDVLRLQRDLNTHAEEPLTAVGAGPRHIVTLLVLEAALLTALGVGVGLGALYGALALGQPLVEAHFGLPPPHPAPRHPGGRVSRRDPGGRSPHGTRSSAARVSHRPARWPRGEALTRRGISHSA